MSVSCLFLLLLCVVSCIAPDGYGDYSLFNQGKASGDPWGTGNGGQTLDEALAPLQQVISGTTNFPSFASPQIPAHQPQGPTYTQYTSPSPYIGTPTYGSTYSTGATPTSFGIHSSFGLSSSPLTQSHGTVPPATYPQQHQPLFSPMDSNGGGDNGLPRSLIIPMSMEGGKLFAEMTVGTAKSGQPDQTLTVEFDTGSTQLWLLSADMCRPPTGRCRANAKWFDRSKSSTYKPDGSSNTSKYGSGSVTGTYGKDTITLGEPGNQLVIKDQMIGEAKTITDTLLSHSDAICGMGLESLEVRDRGDRDSFLDTMAKQYGTTLPFGFYYNRQNPQQSKMIFGEDYQQFIGGELHTHKVQLAPRKDKYDGWYVQFGGSWVIEKTGYAATQVAVYPEMLALVDTGASLIVGKEDMIKQIKEGIFSYANINPKLPEYTFPCENPAMVFSELPNVSFYIDNIKYTIAPQQYIARLGDKCGALFDGRPGIDHIILGRPFFNTYFSRFNHSEKTVQFALAN